MPNPHIIRLRTPWQLQALVRYLPLGAGELQEQSADLPPAAKAEVPGDWTQLLGADFLGRVCYSRSFNCPTNLEANERLWLVCEGVDGAADFSLNGTPIFALAGVDRSGSCDVTSHLRPHNQLTVDVTLLPEGHPEHTPRAAGRAGRGGGITGEVRLEIRRDAT